MNANRTTPVAPSLPALQVTEFDVESGGTLRMANYQEAEIRADFYEYVASFWWRSPADLAEAMDECQPLAWAVQSIYSDFRDELEADVLDAQSAEPIPKKRFAALQTRLGTLPAEPEDGAEGWLIGLTSREFEDMVVPRIEKWFASSPDWNFEDDYLPDSATAQGAALEFFRGMDSAELDLLGVCIVEGDRPGSTYYAAELRGEIEAANNTAVENHIPVLFVRHEVVAEETHKKPLSTVGNGVKSSTPVSARADSIKILRAILDEPPGDGTFNERHRLPSGVEVTHSCSQAAGFAALHLASQYRARFGKPPIWFETCHPRHRRKLCEWALENHMPLPEEMP